MSQYLPPKVYTLLLIAFIGAFIGYNILVFGAQSTAASRNYVSNPLFAVWAFLYSITFALYACLAYPLWRQIVQFREYFDARNEAIITTVFVIALIFFPDIYGHLTSNLSAPPLPYQWLKVIANITTGTIAIVVPIVLSLCFIYISIRRLEERRFIDLHVLQKYLHHRNLLSTLIFILGIYIGLGILSAAALRQLLLATGVRNQSDFPITVILLYGSYFTVLLAFFYIPIYIALLRFGHRLLNNFFPLPDPATNQWKQLYEKRKDFEDFLELKTSVGQNIQAGLAVLAPLLSSIISALLS